MAVILFMIDKIQQDPTQDPVKSFLILDKILSKILWDTIGS